MYNIKDFEQPSISTDALLFAYDIDENKLKMILIERNSNAEFYPSYLSLIGGFTHPNVEMVDDCILTIKNKTGILIDKSDLKAERIINTIGRDPRGWIVSLPYLSYLSYDKYKSILNNKTSNIRIIDIIFDSKDIKLFLNNKELTSEDFAFDHYDIIIYYANELKKSLAWSGEFMALLNDKFTLSDAFELYSIIKVKNDLVINNFKRTYKSVLINTNEKLLTKNTGPKPLLYKLSKNRLLND